MPAKTMHFSLVMCRGAILQARPTPKHHHKTTRYVHLQCVHEASCQQHQLTRLLKPSSPCVLQFSLCAAVPFVLCFWGKDQPETLSSTQVKQSSHNFFQAKKAKENPLLYNNTEPQFTVHTKPQRIYLFCAHKTPKDLPILCTQNPKGLPYCHSLCTQNPKGFTYSYKTPKDFHKTWKRNVTVVVLLFSTGLSVHCVSLVSFTSFLLIQFSWTKAISAHGALNQWKHRLLR